MKSISKHLSRLVGNILAPVRDPFPRDIAGLREATTTETVALQSGAVFDLRAGPVRKRIGDATVKMLAYNCSIPGPLCRSRRAPR